MTAWHTIALVAGREFRARRKAVAIVIGLTVLAVVAGMSIASLNSTSSAPAAISSEDADEVVGFLGTIVLFLAIIFTGQVILLGVAEEKNSRVVEVVLGTVRARHLLAGKILAIGLMGIAEVVVAATTVVVTGSALNSLEVPSATIPAAITVVGWFAIGFAFYATVYAGAGSVVGRTENAANAAVPINIAIVAGYFIAMSSIESADNPVLRIASLLPPLAPLTMPLRMINDTAEIWEVALAATLAVAAAYGLVRLAGRVYLGGVLQSGKVGPLAAFRRAERTVR